MDDLKKKDSGTLASKLLIKVNHCFERSFVHILIRYILFTVLASRQPFKVYCRLLVSE